MLRECWQEFVRLELPIVNRMPVNSLPVILFEVEYLIKPRTTSLGRPIRAERRPEQVVQKDVFIGDVEVTVKTSVCGHVNSKCR